jgi:hypothetical protein
VSVICSPSFPDSEGEVKNLEEKKGGKVEKKNSKGKEGGKKKKARRVVQWKDKEKKRKEEKRESRDKSDIFLSQVLSLPLCNQRGLAPLSFDKVHLPFVLIRRRKERELFPNRTREV